VFNGQLCGIDWHNFIERSNSEFLKNFV